MVEKTGLPKELVDSILQLIQEARTGGKLRKGTNETTKSVERNEPKLVVVASDVSPQEIVMHIPMLCDEKKIPYTYVPSKAELGAAAGLPVSTSAVGIVSAGEAAKKLSQIVEQIELMTGKKSESAKMREAKAAEKAEEPKPTPKPKREPKRKEEKPEKKKEAAVVAVE